MKKAKFTAIIGMAVMMSIPVASLAGNEKQVEIVNETSVTVKVLIRITEVF